MHIFVRQKYIVTTCTMRYYNGALGGADGRRSFTGG